MTRRNYLERNAMQDILYCLMVIVAVVANARFVHTHGLNSPCGDSSSDAPQPPTSIVRLHRNDVLSKVEEVQGITNQLREQYERIPLPEIYSEQVTGLPGPEEIPSYQNMTIDYIVVSHLLVFVDIACIDNGTPRAILRPHRRALWHQLRLRILSLLCNMYDTMVHVPHVSNDITLPCVREASCNGPRSGFTRNSRNFVIASAVRDVFIRLHRKYSSLAEN